MRMKRLTRRRRFGVRHGFLLEIRMSSGPDTTAAAHDHLDRWRHDPGRRSDLALGRGARCAPCGRSRSRAVSATCSSAAKLPSHRQNVLYIASSFWIGQSIRAIPRFPIRQKCKATARTQGNNKKVTASSSPNRIGWLLIGPLPDWSRASAVVSVPARNSVRVISVDRLALFVWPAMGCGAANGGNGPSFGVESCCWGQQPFQSRRKTE